MRSIVLSNDEETSQEDRIVIALRRIMRAVDLHSRQLVQDHGLTGPQLAVLRVVVRSGPLAAGAVAREVQLSQATVTGIVSRLESRGLVARRRSEADRRSVLVECTESGARALVRAPSLLQDRFRERLTGLKDWEQSSILATLQRIAAMMDAGDLSAGPHLHPQHDLAATPPVLDPGPAHPADDAEPQTGTDLPGR